MSAVKQRNDPVRLFWQRMAIFGLFAVFIFGLWAVVGVYLKDRESRNLRAEAERELTDLQVREKALVASIASLETERGKEEALRDAYEVGKAGEGMVVIVDETPSAAKEPPPPEKKWFEKLKWW